MKSHITVTLILFITGLSQHRLQAQEERFIEVYGIAERSVVPDEILYSVSINTEQLYDEYQYNYDFDQFDPVKSQEIQNKVELRVKSAENQLLGVLEKLGIKDKETRSNPYNLSGQDTYNTNAYLIELENYEMLEQLVSELKPFNLFQGWITRMDYREEEKVKEELKLEALQKAREKAQKMAKSLDASLGPVIQIRETMDAGIGEVNYGNVYYNGSEYYNNSRRSEPGDHQRIPLRVEVWVRFALK